MRFRAEDYREAASERLREAALAQSSAAYVSAHINSGLAIECMLRAYKLLSSPEFEARHDLSDLAAELLRQIPARRRLSVKAAIAEAASLWMNNHRYCSSRKLRSYFNTIKQYGKERDMLRANGDRMIRLARIVVESGEAKWNDLI
jgi:HEPN domain-containing protein